MSENHPVDSPLPYEGLIAPNQMDKQYVAYDAVEDDTRYDKMIQVNRRVESLSLLVYVLMI